MSYTYTYESLATDLGTSTADGLRNVANAAANFQCALWTNAPDLVYDVVGDNPASQFRQALVSRLCSPRGPAPTPLPSAVFTGGQCPKLYNVNVQGTYGPSNLPFNSNFFNLLGPIKGVTSGPSTTAGRVAWQILFQISSAYPKGALDIVSATTAGAINPFNLTSITVTPQSGPDNCGDPPPAYPPKSPPSSVTNSTTNINIGGGVVVAAPIAIVPVFNTAFVDPIINAVVNVGPFQVTFDLGGVTITPNFTTGSGGETSPNPDSLPTGTPTAIPAPTVNQPCDLTSVLSAIAGVKTELDNVQTVVEATELCACPVSYTIGVVSLGSGNSGSFPLPSLATTVNLTLTQIPANAKTQPGGSSAPDIYYCGWIRFGSGAATGPKITMAGASCDFEVPPWATAFYFTLYEGYLGEATCSYQIPSKPGVEPATKQLKLLATS